MRTEPPASVGYGPLLVVLDDHGTATEVTGGSDQFDVILFPFAAEPGLSCREYVAGLSAQPTATWREDGPETYTSALAYWFLEKEPARMDADADGIPCEEFFSRKVVGQVWAGEF
jgi:hypothetical protein